MMRRLFTYLLLLQSYVLFAQIHCSKACAAFDHVSPKLFRLAELQSEDLTYLRANWEVDPSQRYISGSTYYRFSVLSAQYDSLRLGLSDSLLVDSILFRGESVAFQHQSEVLSIALVGLTTGDTVSLTIFYRGTPASSGFGSFVQTNTPYGKPIVWTLSQPFGASDWWPCKEGFTDKIDSSDYFINIPLGNRAAGMGILAEIDTVENRQIFHWKHRYPIATYLVALAVTDYAEIKRSVPLREGNLELLNYCYPEHLGEWDWQQTEVMNMLQYFDSLFVPYPFMREKYGHAQFSWGGGMEHQTMSFMADLGPWLTSHELAHMWFGDMITCSSWKDIWLNEGFATYLTGLFFERFSNPSFYYWKRNNRDEICAQPGGSVRVDDTLAVERIFDGRLTYYKGAMVLHMLRKKLGDEPFFEGIRTYLNRGDLRFGFANTQQFEQSMEETTGMNLDRFFNDWYAGEGYPNITISYSLGVDKITLDIQQEGSSSATPLFETRVPLRILGENDSLDVDIAIRDATTRVELPIGFIPMLLKADPEADYLARYSVQQIESAESWQPYPNPLLGSSSLTLPYFGKPANLQLFSNDGKLVYTSTSDKTIANELHFEGLPAGVYWLQISLEDNLSYTKKLVLIP